MYSENKIEEEVIEDYVYEIKHVPSDVGWLQIKLPPTAIARLKDYMNAPEREDATQSLAGNITSSVFLKDVDDWFFKNYVEFMAHDYRNIFPDDPLKFLGQRNFEKHPFMLDSLWVNYQKQTEFNPGHTHSAVYSFVIFMKIPTHWEEQHALPFSARSNSPRAGDFCFEYLSGLGKRKTEIIKMEPSWEEHMFFFPADLTHTVYPFYNCDEDRITISGNVGFNTNIRLLTDEEITQKHKERDQVNYG